MSTYRPATYHSDKRKEAGPIAERDHYAVRRAPAPDWAERYLETGKPQPARQVVKRLESRPSATPVSRTEEPQRLARLAPDGEVATRLDEIALLRRRIAANEARQWREASRKGRGGYAHRK